MKLDIPTQILDVLGNALVVAAKHAPESQTGVYVQAWAWLSAESQKAAAEEERSAKDAAEAEMRRRIESELKE